MNITDQFNLLAVAHGVHTVDIRTVLDWCERINDATFGALKFTYNAFDVALHVEGINDIFDHTRCEMRHYYGLVDVRENGILLKATPKSDGTYELQVKTAFLDVFMRYVSAKLFPVATPSFTHGRASLSDPAFCPLVMTHFSVQFKEAIHVHIDNPKLRD